MMSKEICRDDLLILLSSMGIVLPDTKLTVDELNKKLGLAFDASQQLWTHLPTTPIDPSTFPLWDVKKDDDGDTLFEATQRRNMSEMLAGVMQPPKQGGNAKKEEMFKEMRQSIMGIAFMFDQGLREICYVDENGIGILINVLEVRKVNKDIPLFLFDYREFILNPGDKYPTTASVAVLDLERRALLKLFRRNTKKLQENDTESGRHSLTHRSFVLPLCPLNMQSLGKLTYNAGCQACGKKDTSRCLQCLSVGYCSKECQKEDWPDHKTACKSLKGGTWSTIKLSKPLGNFCTLINRLDPLSSSAATPYSIFDSTSIHSDAVHKGKIFLAKFQIALTESIAPHMLIYDRQRTFHLTWLRSSDPSLFDNARRIMAEHYKIYRWVRRVGEVEMDICLDRSPLTDPVW